MKRKGNAKLLASKKELTVADIVRFFASYGWDVDFRFVPVRREKTEKASRKR